MISVKSACDRRWFSDQDSDELCSLDNEIRSSFGCTMNFKKEPTDFILTVSRIMSRFYPRMKMGEILSFLEIKSGYGTYVSRFQISKDMKSTPEESIRLFVAQMDNIETSSCLKTPTHANFLLNGKGVERRTNAFMDTRPQMPTPVYNLLGYGANLLQAVGEFNGCYIIVIAFMSMISTPHHSALQDYVQPTLSSKGSDSEVVAGPFRISLNCPISLTRIKIPVKGHMCNHLQCFDYENYMEINLRRPSWRCPYCNQYLSFTDIRIDQNMVKVLKEVEENVNDVLISSDGSWKAIMESDDPDDKPQDGTTTSQHDGTVQAESSSITNAPAEVVDLTLNDYEMDTSDIHETEDRKVSLTDSQTPSDIQNMAVKSHMQSANEINQNTATHIEDNFWPGIYLSTYGSGASSSRSESQIGGVSGPTQFNLLSTNQGAGPFHGNSLVATSIPQREISSLNALQVQPFEFGNTPLINEYGRFASITRNLSQTPNTIQALLSRNPTSVASQASAMSLVADGLISAPSNRGRLQLFSRAQCHPLQGSCVAPRTFQQHHQNLHSPRQLQSSYRVSSEFPTKRQAIGQQQPMLNTRAGFNLSPGMMRPPSASFSRGSSQAGFGQATGIVGSQQARPMAVAHRDAQMARPVLPSRASSHNPVNIRYTPLMGSSRQNLAGVAPPVTRMDISRDLQEQNWRPTGHMHGSLLGRTHSDALQQLIIQPRQQAQAPRPVSNLTSLSASAHNEILVAANRAALAHAGNYPYTGSTSTPNGSGVLPERRG